jgi:hypothetical protein
MGIREKRKKSLKDINGSNFEDGPRLQRIQSLRNKMAKRVFCDSPDVLRSHRLAIRPQQERHPEKQTTTQQPTTL